MAGGPRELLAGASLLGRGATLLLRRPRLFGLGAIPPAITSLVFIAVLVVLGLNLERLVAAITPFADGGSGLTLVIRVLVGTALVAGVVLIMVISFTTLTLAVGSPIYDKLSAHIEAEFGPVPELTEPASVGVRRAVRQSAALIVTAAVGTVGLFAAGFIPVVGQTLVPVFSAMFGGWLLGIELVGSAFERRGLLTLRERRQAMNRRRARVLGFAIPTFLLLSIPLVGVVVFPIATAGGTLLARQLLREPT